MGIGTREKIKRIYEILPKMDCGLCGFESCSKFARAVAQGNTSPFGCRQAPGTGYLVDRIMSADGPIDLPSSKEALAQDLMRLSNKVNDILARIDKLKAGKH